MNCPRCNSQVQPGNSFCSSCGFNLNEQNNVNNNNFNSQNNMNNNNQQMYNNNMMNNQQGMNMNNQQMMYNNQMQQGNYNQYQQGTPVRMKGSRAFKIVLVLDCILIPLLLIKFIGGGFGWDDFSTLLLTNAVGFSLYVKDKKNNM